MNQKDYENIGWLVVWGSVFIVTGTSILLGVGGFFLSAGVILLMAARLYERGKL